MSLARSPWGWLLTAAALAVGCGGPWGPIAGGRLHGEVLPAPQGAGAWKQVIGDAPHMEIEVRPDRPYSVKIHYYDVADRLYFEAGLNGWSRWRGFLREDPRVRVRFGEQVFTGTVAEVRDRSEIESVLPAFYAKDRDEPSTACAASWSLDDCTFDGAFYRFEPVNSQGE